MKDTFILPGIIVSEKVFLERAMQEMIPLTR